PFGFISGGTTGLGLIGRHFWHWNFNMVVTGVNIVMFIVGFIFIGKKFAATTLLATFIYPLLLEVTSYFTDQIHLTNDPLIACVMMDIPPIVLNKFFHWPVAVVMNLFDLTELLFQATFSPITKTVCGIIMLFTTTFIMNRILTFGHTSYQVLLISTQYEAIRNLLIHDLDKGLTLLKVETGYHLDDSKALLSVVNQKDLHSLRSGVYAIDPHAFMIVSKVTEVRGENFTDWTKINRTERFLNS
uniref:YitT family protein n=1 Tax=uncultured Sharpea sp. TaxID=1112738 RepID=UPI00258E60FF